VGKTKLGKPCRESTRKLRSKDGKRQPQSPPNRFVPAGSGCLEARAIGGWGRVANFRLQFVQTNLSRSRFRSCVRQVRDDSGELSLSIQECSSKVPSYPNLVVPSLINLESNLASTRVAGKPARQSNSIPSAAYRPLQSSYRESLLEREGYVLMP
jgi:hypothetical protein